jgi:hypothetical protein
MTHKTYMTPKTHGRVGVKTNRRRSRLQLAKFLSHWVPSLSCRLFHTVSAF